MNASGGEQGYRFAILSRFSHESEFDFGVMIMYSFDNFWQRNPEKNLSVIYLVDATLMEGTAQSVFQCWGTSGLSLSSLSSRCFFQNGYK